LLRQQADPGTSHTSGEQPGVSGRRWSGDCECGKR
jgi:hypothetical protein